MKDDKDSVFFYSTNVSLSWTYPHIIILYHCCTSAELIPRTRPPGLAPDRLNYSPDQVTIYSKPANVVEIRYPLLPYSSPTKSLVEHGPIFVNDHGASTVALMEGQEILENVLFAVCAVIERFRVCM